MNPLISIIIPVYGVENYIEQCLRSLFENTIADKCEFIIVNDCTKDNSMQIVKKLLSEYPTITAKIINHEKNLGIAATRNTGLKNAVGKYIIYTDSDDWVEKDYLEKLYTQAEASNADITACDWYEESNRKTLFVSGIKSNSKENFINFMQCNIPAYAWNKLVKHSLFVENKFEWINGINNWEDELMCTKLFSRARVFASVSEPLYHYRVRYNSYIRCLTTEKTKDDFLNAVFEIEKYLHENNFTSELELVNFKKNRVKQKILLDGTRAMQKKYIYLYRESYSFIKHDTQLSKHSKIILLFAINFPFIARTLLFFISVLKIILRKQFTWKDYMGKF